MAPSFSNSEPPKKKQCTEAGSASESPSTLIESIGSEDFSAHVQNLPPSALNALQSKITTLGTCIQDYKDGQKRTELDAAQKTKRQARLRRNATKDAARRAVFPKASETTRAVAKMMNARVRTRFFLRTLPILLASETLDAVSLGRLFLLTNKSLLGLVASHELVWQKIFESKWKNGPAFSHDSNMTTSPKLGQFLEKNGYEWMFRRMFCQNKPLLVPWTESRLAPLPNDLQVLPSPSLSKENLCFVILIQAADDCGRLQLLHTAVLEDEEEIKTALDGQTCSAPLSDAAAARIKKYHEQSHLPFNKEDAIKLRDRLHQQRLLRPGSLCAELVGILDGEKKGKQNKHKKTKQLTIDDTRRRELAHLEKLTKFMSRCRSKILAFRLDTMECTALSFSTPGEEIETWMAKAIGLRFDSAADGLFESWNHKESCSIPTNYSGEGLLRRYYNGKCTLALNRAYSDEMVVMFSLELRWDADKKIEMDSWTFCAREGILNEETDEERFTPQHGVNMNQLLDYGVDWH